MDSLISEHEKLASAGNLGKSVEDVQKIIDLLTNARDVISSSMIPLRISWSLRD